MTDRAPASSTAAIAPTRGGAPVTTAGPGRGAVEPGPPDPAGGDPAEIPAEGLAAGGGRKPGPRTSATAATTATTAIEAAIAVNGPAVSARRGRDARGSSGPAIGSRYASDAAPDRRGSPAAPGRR